MHGGIGGDADFRASIMPRRVSGSRLSPMSTTSGAARTVARGRQKRFQMFGIVLCDRPAGARHRNQTRWRFISADIAPAAFDDAPQNGGQQRGFVRSHDAVTSTRPLDGMAWSRIPCSTFRSSRAGGMEGMVRKTILTPVE